MDDTEGGLSFDFEGGLETTATANPSASINLNTHDSINVSGLNQTTGPSANTAAESLGAGGGVHNGRRSFRQTVCRHWLRSLCMKGDACGFLHQYDKSRMPVCRFFRLYGECREQDCVYKHTNEDIKECNMYKLGFCPNGPDCRYRHAKLPGPPPPVEEVFQKIQHLSNFNYNSSNRFFQNRNSNYNQQTERPPFPPGSNPANPALVAKQPTTADSPNIQQHSQAPQPQQQQVNQAQPQTIQDGLSNQDSKSVPLPQGLTRYFIVKSCNRENLELSVQQGVWATQRSNEAKLNEAFDSAENVVLIFSVNRTRHFQGCAKMMSKIGGYVGGGNWKYAHGTAHYGRNFSVKWLKLCELSFHKTRHLRNPYNENLPVKISRDCQELESSVGEQLASLLYLEPDSELMAISVAAEIKREEEKAKGVNPDEGAENPDIVPFEDNEEEEEEESEEEDEGYNQALAAGIGRGRGRGMMWPPQMLGRGARPLPGVRGFPPVMMGPDGFPYGGVTPDGFPVPDMFRVAPRMFPPFGPRFPGDFSGMGPNPGMGFNPMDGNGPAAGMGFHGRPQQPGNAFPGMMMGPGRGPFMGGMGVPPGAQVRGNRPMGMQQFRQPPPQSAQNPNWVVKRDQRRPGSDRYSAGSDQSKGQEMAGSGPDEEAKYQQGRPQSEDSYGGVGGGSSFRNDDSESEDEAPRRSRHGEGKKR